MEDKNTVSYEVMKNLNPGMHFCSIYKNKEEQFSVVVPFMLAGLTHHEKCVYIVDENTKEEILGVFRKVGTDIAPYLASGQFVFLAKEESYLKDGFFDPDRMMALLRQAQAEALGGGYSGLRITGEMTWVFTRLPGVDRLLEYESRLNDFLPTSKTIAICQYNETRFSREILIDVIHTHTQVIIYGLVCSNPHYIPTDIFLARLKGQPLLGFYESFREDLLERTRLAVEHARAEEALEESEGRYRSFVRNFRGIAYRGYMNFMPVFFHGLVEEITGYTEAELTSGRLKWDQIIHPDDFRRLSVSIQKLRTVANYSSEREYRIFRKDGQLRWVREFIQNICDDAGKPVLVQGVLYDISERKHSEEAIANLNQCFLTFGPDADKNIESITKTAGMILGGACALYNRLEGNSLCVAGKWQAPYDMPPKDSAEGHICAEVISMDMDNPFVVRNLDSSRYAQTDPNVRKYNLKTYIGSVVRVRDIPLGSLCVVYQEDREFREEDFFAIAFLARALGVEEERREAKRVLQESEERFRAIYEKSPIGIELYDCRGELVDVNPAGLDIFGVSDVAQVRGFKLFEDPKLPDAEKEKLKNGEAVRYEAGFDFEKVKERRLYNTERAGIIYVDVAITPLTLRGELGYLVQVRDITKRKKAAIEVNALKQRMEFILGVTKTGLDIIDAEFNIRYIDPAWAKVYGDPVGKKCYEYFMGRNQVCPGCGIVKALETRESMVTEEILVKENDRPIQVTTIPFQSEEGEWMVAEVNVDISERKKAEEALKDRVAEIERHNKFMIDRESRIIELKREVNSLLEEFGRARKYTV